MLQGSLNPGECLHYKYHTVYSSDYGVCYSGKWFKYTVLETQQSRATGVECDIEIAVTPLLAYVHTWFEKAVVSNISDFIEVCNHIRCGDNSLHECGLNSSYACIQE